MKKLTSLVLITLLYSLFSYAQIKPVVQIGHSDDVLSVAFSPDGRFIASGSWDKTIKLWDVETGKLVKTFKGHSSGVLSVAFSPDGRFIASGSWDKTIKLWSVRNSILIKTLKSSLWEVELVAFSPDGKYVVSGGFYGEKKGSEIKKSIVIELWNVEIGKIVRKFEKAGDSVNSVAFSPDGRYIAAGGNNGIIYLWNINNGKLIKNLKNSWISNVFNLFKRDKFGSDSVNSVAFSPDGRYIAAGNGNGTIKLWDVESGRLVETFKGHNNPVLSVAFSPDGRFIASSSKDDTIKLWDVKTGRLVKTFEGLSDDILSVTFSPDGRFIASGRSDGTIKLRNVETGKLVKTFKGHSDLVRSVAFSPDGRFIASGGENTIRLWNIKTANLLKTLESHKGGIYSISFSPSGKYISTGGLYQAELWDIHSGKTIKTFEDINLVKFSSNGNFLALCKTSVGLSYNYHSIVVWNLKTNKEMLSFARKSKRLCNLNFSPDSKLIAYMRVYKIGEPARFLNTQINVKGINIELRPLKIELMNITTGEIVKSFGEFFGVTKSYSFNFSPSGKYIVVGNGSTIELWNIETGNLVRTFKGHKDNVNSVAFSPDGRFIASGSSDNTIKLWEVDTGKLIKTFKGHSNTVESVAFSPDGKFIASGSEDKTIKLWNVETGKLLATFIAFPDASVVITPEGYFTGTGEYQKYVHFVDTRTLKVYTFDQYEETFYRPDLVKLALQGEDISKIAKLNINQVKPAPEVEIIDTPTKTNNKYITIKIKITEQGGGIGDTVIYLNGTAIKLDNTRSIKRKNNKKIVYEEYQIPLVNGKNEIQVKVYNQQKTQISRPATHIVYADFKSIKKPNLYALIIGIDQYRNPKLNLKYATDDAVALSKLLKEKATKSGLYNKVEIITLTTKDQTTKENILKTLKEISKKVQPEDVFFFYVASHGTVRDGKFYLLTSNVGSTSTFGLNMEAITQEQLKTALTNIPTSKKIFVFDTCNSGKIASELQYAMLTRGLDDDVAMEIMSKSIGAMIISASKEYQEAIEGYKGHGLFTYALLEGLKGNADTNKDNYLMTLELATYVYNKVPEIARNIFNKEQFVDIAPVKDTFPILKIDE